MTMLQRALIRQMRRALTELEARTNGDALAALCIQLLAMFEESLQV